MASYEEVKDLPNHPDKLLIDVRSLDELKETGTIPCSINIPLAELEKNLKLSADEFEEKYKVKKPETNTTIIFSCKLGGRAQKATDLAKDLGFTNAKPYKGSWSEWAKKEGL